MASSELTDRYVTTPEAARFLGLSPRTLEKHRAFGTGPLYRKLGGRVVYAPEDLRSWANRGARNSTTENAKDSIKPAKRDPNGPKPKGHGGRRKKSDKSDKGSAK